MAGLQNFLLVLVSFYIIDNARYLFFMYIIQVNHISKYFVQKTNYTPPLKRLKYKIIELPPIYSRSWSTYISRFPKSRITTSKFSTNQNVSCLSICCCFSPQNNWNGLNHHENSEFIKQYLGINIFDISEHLGMVNVKK